LKDKRFVPCIVIIGGPKGTVPELLFEKRDLIPEIQGLITGYAV
jgi:hypothetical protein